MTVLEDSAKTTRTLWIYVSISMALVLVLNGCFSQQAIANLPVMALVEQLSDTWTSEASKGLSIFES